MTNEEAKQQAIENAWLEILSEKEYLEIKKYLINGALDVYILPDTSSRFSINCDNVEDYWIPRKIKNIEFNNFWKRIASENDLPKDDCKCWVITSTGEVYMSLYLSGCQKFWELMDLDFQLHPTHYMSIITPKPPIY